MLATRSLTIRTMSARTGHIPSNTFDTHVVRIQMLDKSNDVCKEHHQTCSSLSCLYAAMSKIVGLGTGALPSLIRACGL